MKNLIVLLFSIVTFASKVYAILLINKEEPVYYFVNHEEQIISLRKKLLTDKIVGITGITGMGKSEMVRKYVQEYKQDYEIIAFLDASIDLIPQFILIAKEINQQICLKSNCYIAEDPKNVKASLMLYLKPKSKWLLIFDNLHINENEKVKDIIEWHHQGHIIICSQDSKYLLSKLAVPYLKDEHAAIIINKIMGTQSQKFIEELVQSLRGYPTNIISQSTIFLQNNSHVNIKEYINHIQKHDNKIRAYLEVVLKEITPQGKELLYNIT